MRKKSGGSLAADCAWRNGTSPVALKRRPAPRLALRSGQHGKGRARDIACDIEHDTHPFAGNVMVALLLGNRQFKVILSFSRSLWKHFRAVSLCLFLLIFPAYMAYMICQFFHMDFWLLIIISSSILTSLQVSLELINLI